MFDFTKDFVLKGKWWIPGEGKDENHGIYGELYFSGSKGITLHTEGSLFGSKSIHEARHNERISLVHGIIKYLHHVSLFDLMAFESGEQIYLKTQCTVGYAFYSEQGYFASEKMYITGVNFSSNIFNPFLKNVRSFFSLGKYEEGKKHFEYKEVPPIKIMDDETNVYFQCSYNFKGFNRDATEFVFRDKAFLNIHFKSKPILIEDVNEKIRFFRNFFTFFSYPAVCFHTAYAFTYDEEGTQVQFSFLSKENNAILPQGVTSDVLIFYEEMEKDFACVFRRWLENEKTLNSGLSLYLQTKTGNSESVIQSFLNLVFALETLHNTYFDKPYFTSYEMKSFKEIKKIAFEHFSEKHKRKLNDCLSHLNSLSFVERLKDLIKMNYNLLQHYIYNVNDFCSRVKKQRNFLAHNHAVAIKAAIEKDDYFYFIAVLKTIFECSFLRAMGLDEKLIDLRIKRHHTYRYFKDKVDHYKRKFEIKS